MSAQCTTTPSGWTVEIYTDQTCWLISPDRIRKPLEVWLPNASAQAADPESRIKESYEPGDEPAEVEV